MPCASCPYKAAAKGLVRRTLTLAFRQGTRRVLSFLTLRTPHLKRLFAVKSRLRRAPAESIPKSLARDWISGSEGCLAFFSFRYSFGRRAHKVGFSRAHFQTFSIQILLDLTKNT